MILDANILLYAVDSSSPQHGAASGWLEETLNGPRRVGLPAHTVSAFVRIVTHPRVMARPSTPREAWRWVASWLDAGPVWVPPLTEQTVRLLGELVVRHQITGNLTTDALLAAHAVEQGVPVASADSDFARFPEVRWVNPLHEVAR